MKKFISWLLVIALGVAGLGYWVFYVPNTAISNGKKAVVFIPQGADFDQLMDSLVTKGAVQNTFTFKWAARYEKLPTHVNPGRYVVSSGTHNKQLARTLAMGWQTPLNLTLSGRIRSFEKLAALMAKPIAADSLQILKALRNDSLRMAFGFDEASYMGMFIPNTYQVYWTVTPEQLLARFHQEYVSFWNEERTQNAAKIGLTPREVSTLAAIVDEETSKVDEMADVAGVYMNRLRIRMPLQADPTVLFAVRQNDASQVIKRVLNTHLAVDSPYNTYTHSGLPPGPICIPSTSALDAVLGYTHHSYLYFCAKADFSGYHAFAASLQEHNANAAKYHRALTAQKQKATAL